MRCPGCGAGSTFVIDTREAGEWRRRRYRCGCCGARWTTQEIPQHELYKIIKIRDLIRQVMDE